MVQIPSLPYGSGVCLCQRIVKTFTTNPGQSESPGGRRVTGGNPVVAAPWRRVRDPGGGILAAKVVGGRGP